MPMNIANYHPEWKSISRQIREQAGDCCEFCDVRNHQWIYRDVVTGERVFARMGDEPAPPGTRLVWIVLTVAHLDHDTSNNDPANLKALCQSCHLKWDSEHHQRNAAETRRDRRLAAGQTTVLEVG